MYGTRQEEDEGNNGLFSDQIGARLRFLRKLGILGKKVLDNDDVDGVIDVSSLDSRFHEKKVRPWNKAYSLKA
ncbi:hypothetical protein Tco_1457770 [Tanacetum coccineum]